LHLDQMRELLQADQSGRAPKINDHNLACVLANELTECIVVYGFD
jgi:hypothetical protein